MLFNEIKRILKSHKGNITQRGVRALSIFGSTARNQAVAKSDVDILVDFDSKKGLFAFVDLKIYLESILQCKVDLVTKDALHPSLKKKIINEAKNVF